MGYSGNVETNKGDYLCVLGNGGVYRGKALFALLPLLTLYCHGVRQDEEIDQWFASLESNVSNSLCHITNALVSSYYVGEWTYFLGDYEVFRLKQPQPSLTEEEFKQALQEIEDRWGDIDQLIASVEGLLNILISTNLPQNWWYDPDETIEDLRATLETLVLAKRRWASEVRLHFL